MPAKPIPANLVPLSCYAYMARLTGDQLESRLRSPKTETPKIYRPTGPTGPRYVDWGEAERHAFNRPHLTAADLETIRKRHAEQENPDEFGCPLPLPFKEVPIAMALASRSHLKLTELAHMEGFAPITIRKRLDEGRLGYETVRRPGRGPHPTVYVRSLDVAEALAKDAPRKLTWEAMAGEIGLPLAELYRIKDEESAPGVGRHLNAVYLDARDEITLEDYAIISGASLDAVRKRAARGALGIDVHTGVRGTWQTVRSADVRKQLAQRGDTADS